MHYFPNWAQAVTSCGIDYGKIRRNQVWNRRRIKRELMSLAKRREDLSYNEFERKHPELFHAAIYHLGSWKNALSTIGIDYKKVKKPGAWTRERIVREINALKDKGVDLSFRAMFRQGYGALVSMALFYYGSWRRAIEKAGLPYERIRKRQRWSKHRVVVVFGRHFYPLLAEERSKSAL